MAQRADGRVNLIFFTCSYIILVNPLILQDAGVPLSAGIVATLAASIAGCLLMALWANAPVILIRVWGLMLFLAIRWCNLWD